MTIKISGIPITAVLLGISTIAISTATMAQEKTVVGTINGAPITQGQLIGYARVTAPQANLQDQAVRTQLLQTFVGRELLYQASLKQKLDQQPAVQAVLEETRHSVLAQAYVSQLLRDKPVTEAIARDIYDKQVGNQTGAEYHARHILVPSESEANAAINRLKKGEEFVKVAQAVSKDSSASRGGDLGWIKPEKMPPTFGSALSGLKPGKYTTTAVKTDYGWHVIYVEANRPIQPPTFEAVRDQIIKAMQDQIVSQHLGELQKEAKIVFNENSGK